MWFRETSGCQKLGTGNKTGQNLNKSVNQGPSSLKSKLSRIKVGPISVASVAIQQVSGSSLYKYSAYCGGSGGCDGSHGGSGSGGSDSSGVGGVCDGGSGGGVSGGSGGSIGGGGCGSGGGGGSGDSG